jgi:hypothetical protein
VSWATALSFILAGGGIWSLVLSGNRSKMAWLVGGSTQIVWMIFGATTAQYGFCLSAIAFGSVYLRNWIRWTKQERITRDSPAPTA